MSDKLLQKLKSKYDWHRLTKQLFLQLNNKKNEGSKSLVPEVYSLFHVHLFLCLQNCLIVYNYWDSIQKISTKHCAWL